MRRCRLTLVLCSLGDRKVFFSRGRRTEDGASALPLVADNSISDVSDSLGRP